MCSLCGLFSLHVFRGRVRVHVCRNLLSVAVHAGLVRWSSCTAPRRDGFTLQDRWEGIVLRRKWRNKVHSATHPFFPSLTPLLSQLLFPSVSSFLSPILSQFLHQSRTIEVGSVSVIEWLQLMPNYLPLWCRRCVWIGGHLMDFAGRSFERACH